MYRKTKLLKIISLIFIFHFPLLVSIPLFAQSNPIVQVDPVVNLSNEAWLEAVCVAATDNVVFTLKFLGQFDVKSDSTVENESGQLVSAMEIDDQETFDTSLLKTRAEIEGYDNILFGSCTIEDDSYVITMNAYDLALDKITYSGSTEVESIFDTFEAVDEITYQTVEGFSGIHVTYGSLVLVPPVTGEPFSFTIDGTALPEGTFSVDRMPAGVHKLAVSQERPLGVYEAVHDIMVEEEKTNTINILLPSISGDEITVFNQADRYLALAGMGQRSGTVLAMNNLYNLLGSPFFQDFRSRLVKKYDTWVSLLERNIQISREPKILGRLPATFSLNKINKYEIPTFTEHLPFQIENVHQESKNNIQLDIKTITLDGFEEDWEDVDSVINDPIGDYSMENRQFLGGYDLVEVKLAIDSNYLYVMMKSADNKYRIKDLYQHFDFEGNGGTLYFNFDITSSSKLMGYYLNEKNSEYPWNKLTQVVKYKYGEVLEIAVPLETLLESDIFMSQMKLNSYFWYSPNSSWKILDQTDSRPLVNIPIIRALTYLSEQP